MLSTPDHFEFIAAWQVIAAYAFGLALPITALKLAGIPDAGSALQWPGRGGARVTSAGVVLSLPVGFWLAIVTADAKNSPLGELVQYVLMIPEHFLIFGFLGALLLPARRLGWPRGGKQQGADAIYAIAATGIVFGLAHIGKTNDAEIISAFPLGLLFAWMTVLSGSIWPAVIAHCALNLVPMVVLALAQ